MPALNAAWRFIWTHRRYWRGPIIAMLVVLFILFAIATGARILPDLLSSFEGP